jgi:hypothetical protein
LIKVERKEKKKGLARLEITTIITVPAVSVTSSERRAVRPMIGLVHRG